MFFFDEVGSKFHIERKLPCQFHAGLLHTKDLVGDLCGSFSIFGMSYESDSYFVNHHNTHPYNYWKYHYRYHWLMYLWGENQPKKKLAIKLCLRKLKKYPNIS